MSDTPRTDAAARTAAIILADYKPIEALKVVVEESGKLERELARVTAERDALRAQLAEAEKLAYIGEHHFPDLTWKSRCEELVTDLRAAESKLAQARGELEQLQTKLAAVESALARTTKDAERYRWLRENPETEDIYGRMGNELDAAIDAAIAGKREW